VEKGTKKTVQNQRTPADDFFRGGGKSRESEIQGQNLRTEILIRRSRIQDNKVAWERGAGQEGVGGNLL